MASDDVAGVLVLHFCGLVVVDCVDWVCLFVVVVVDDAAGMRRLFGHSRLISTVLI